MLTVILAIGPLARLDRRALPLLYNRRHFGVLTFLVALTHVWFMIEWYAVQDALPNLYAELTEISDYGKFIGFPFKALGIAALLILFLMAATSHDFWLVFLGPPAWKALHMALYVAYGLVVMHVALGVMQSDHNPLIPAMLMIGFAVVTVLHLVAAWRALPTAAPRPPARLDTGRSAALDPRPGGARRCSAGRRAHRGVSRRRGSARCRTCVRIRTARSARPHHRRLRHLPVARLSIPPR